jgi:hypothetical protein
MKINWSASFNDLEGKEVKEGERVLTLAKVAINALCNVVEGDQQLTGEKKFKLGELANKINKEPEAEFEVEEIATIKERIGKLYTPLMVFQSFNLLK